MYLFYIGQMKSASKLRVEGNLIERKGEKIKAVVKMPYRSRIRSGTALWARISQRRCARPPEGMMPGSDLLDAHVAGVMPASCAGLSTTQHNHVLWNPKSVLASGIADVV